MSAAEKRPVVTIQGGPPPRDAITPMEMLDRAISSGASIEVLERLMALSERWEASQARKSFDQAVAGAKAQIPVIVRNATGHNAKKYADFAAIASAVDPILGKHGLSYRFRTIQTDKSITVTCVLFGHGHSEETTLSGPPDTLGNKSPIHAIGSTLTYLQRYSLVQALGLAASNDDDGKGAGNGGAHISQDQTDALLQLIEEVGATSEKFCKIFHIEGVALLPAARYDEAILRLKQYGKAQGIAK